MSEKSDKSLVLKEVIYTDSLPRFVVFTVFDTKDDKYNPIGSIIFYFDSGHKINYRSNVEFSELDSNKLAEAKSLAVAIFTF